MVTKIVKLEDILQQTSSTDESTKELVNNDASTRKKNITSKQPEPVVRGKPKSGRIWKNTKTRFSAIVKTKGIKNSFERKQALREELKRVKETSRAMIAAKQEEKEQKKQRRRENLKRQEENRKKSEVVQVIKNPSKIKRMKKKQLRYIEKRDIDDIKH